MTNKKPKFTGSYNVFDDNLSTLRASIRSVRDSLDHISVVYQEVSNIGVPATENIKELLDELVNEGLVDQIFKYNPIINKGSHYNELTKRNTGMIIAEDNGSDFHISLDSDEFYIKEELEKVKQLYIDENLDVCYAPIISYYKDFEHMYNDDYYVSLFYRIGKDVQYKLALPAPVTIDPTRSAQYKSFKVLDRSDINMHHGSYVRTEKEIVKKFENSSARVNFNDEIEPLIYYFNNWQDGDKGFVAGKPCKKVQLTKIDNLFKHLM